MKHYIDEFLDHIAVERGLAHNTIVAYRHDLTRYVDYLGKNDINHIDDVERAHVTDFMFFLKKKELSTKSITRSLAAMKMFHRFLIRERLAKEDPTGLVETPKIWQTIPDVLSLQEVEAILES
ncbi:MAG: integrase/recombinase XerD, partial [Candidatus Omnitrophota bacterium]